MTTFRNLTVGHTTEAVVFGHLAVRYILDAYVVRSEDCSSGNAKAAVIAYAMNGDHKLAYL